MRASKTRVAPKSARVAADGGRSVSSSAGTQQQSSTGMSSRLQGAVATVVLLGTVVLLMSSSLSQTGPRHTHLRSSLEPAVLDAPSSLRRPALSVTTAAPPGVALEPPAQLASAARRDTTQDLDQANPPEDLAHRAAVVAQVGIVRRDAAERHARQRRKVAGDEADESEHTDAAMLDLSLAQPFLVKVP